MLVEGKKSIEQYIRTCYPMDGTWSQTWAGLFGIKLCPVGLHLLTGVLFCVLLGFIVFHWFLLGFIGFYWVCYWVLLGVIGFDWV